MIHPLDRFFRKKLEHSPHEMEEAHWLQALELLEAQEDRRRRKGIPFWLWIALPVAIGALLWSLYSAPAGENVPFAGLETNSSGAITQLPVSPQPRMAENRLSQSDQEASLPDAEKFNLQDKNVTARQTSKGGVGDMINTPVAGEDYMKKNALPTLINGKNNTATPVANTIPVAEVNQVSIPPENPVPAMITLSGKPAYSTNLLPIPEARPLSYGSRADLSLNPIDIVSGEQVVTPGYALVMGVGAGARLLPVRPSGYSPLPGFEGGLFFTGHIRDNWSWYLDVQYALLQGDLPFTKENQVTQYSFGRQIFDQRLQPLSLHYAAASLSVNRTFGRQSIGLSAGFDRLAGVRGMITVSGAYPPETDTARYNVPVWIKKDGFNRWNIPVRLNWSYQVSQRLSARLGIGYYFRNIFDDQHLYPVPVTSSSLQQFHLETGIRYALFELKSVGK